MNREKVAWTMSLILASVLAFNLPRGIAQRDNDYAFVRTLVDIHRQITGSYVDEVDEQKLEKGAIDGMLGQLDPFSMYVPAAQQEEFDGQLGGLFKGVGIQLNQTDDGKIEVVTPIDGSPAFKAGVEAGDIILKVNGQSLEGLKLVDVIKKIGGKLGSEVTLHVRHETGEEADLHMAREEIVVPTVKGFARKPDNTWDYYASEAPRIGYIRIVQFTPGTFEKLKIAVEDLLKTGMQGMVLDLRWNPGGRLDEAIKIVNLFVDKGVIVSTKGLHRPERIETADPKQALVQKFPMVVLVNEHSASASEIVAGSLMDNKRAVVIGVRSYGKGSVQEVMPLDGDNGELKLTVAYYYLPSGRLVHKKKDATDWGVDPQIKVAMDEAAEHKVEQDRFDQELLRHRVQKVSTRPTTAGSTQPTTRPVDLQLQQGINSLITFIIFDNNRGDFVTSAPAASQPTTKASK